MTYIWVAYSIVWVVLFGYMLFIGNKQSKIIKEMETLKDLYK